MKQLIEEIKHKLFHNILNDDERIQSATLNEIFNTVDLTVDFSGATNIIERVCHVYEVASNIENLPCNLVNEYRCICAQLNFAINTDSFKQSIPLIKTSKNEILLRMGDYPLSALLAAPLSQTNKNDKSKKYLLDLLTFLLIEIKRKSPTLNRNIIKNAATLIRKYATGKPYLKQGIKKRPINFTQLRELISRVTEVWTSQTLLDTK